MAQTPSVGRIVHYESRGSADGHFRSEPRAAIITEVFWGDAAYENDWQGIEQPERPSDGQADEYIYGVSLAVLNPTGMFFNENVPYSPEPKPGHWSWPPRV